MRKIRISKQIEHKINTSLPAITAKYVAAVGLRYFKPDDLHKYGVMVVLFTVFDASDKAMYYQVRYELEDEKDKNYVISSPFNIDNLDSEFRSTTMASILRELKPGVTLLHTNLDFTKFSGKYQFEAIFHDLPNSTLITQVINCDTSVYIRLSQFVYWLTSDYPLYLQMFNDPKYNNLKITKVDRITFDGSCNYSVSNGTDMMIHFTLYFRDAIDDLLFDEKKYGFNIPYRKIEGKIQRKPLLTPEYITLFGDDDTVTSDRIFFVSTPSKAVFILSKGESSYRLFMIDMKLVEKYHLLDLEENIYF